MARAHTSARSNVVAWAILFALAGASLGCSFLSLGRASMAVALAFAAAKASIVVVVFMQLGRARPSARIALLTALAFVLVLVALVATDVLTRATFAIVPPLERP